MRRRWVRVTVWAGAVVIALVATAAVVGSLRTTEVITVSRTTTASPEVVWRYWADVDGRTSWDTGLDWIRADGPFAVGTTGEVKVEGQEPRPWEIVELTPLRSFTDRFPIPMSGTMDWHHTITELGDGRREVTWRIEATGPGSLLSAPVLHVVLGEELPGAVDRFVVLAERESATG